MVEVEAREASNYSACSPRTAMQLRGALLSHGSHCRPQLQCADPALSHWGRTTRAPCGVFVVKASKADDRQSRRPSRTPDQTYAVRRYAPPQDDLGAVTALLLANGDSLELNGAEYVVARVATTYQLRRGKYEVGAAT